MLASLDSRNHLYDNRIPRATEYDSCCPRRWPSQPRLLNRMPALSSPPESPRAFSAHTPPSVRRHAPNHRASSRCPPLSEPEKSSLLTEETENRQLLNSSSLFQHLRLPECDANFCKTVNREPEEGIERARLGRQDRRRWRESLLARGRSTGPGSRAQK